MSWKNKKELREAIEAKKIEIRKIQDAAATGTNGLPRLKTAEERTAFDAGVKMLNGMEAELRDMETAEGLDTGKPGLQLAGGDGDEGEQRSIFAPDWKPSKQLASKEYRQAFAALVLAGAGGLAALPAEQRQILTTSQDGTNGIVGPSEFLTEYVAALKNLGGIYEAPIRIINSPTGMSLYVPTVDDTANAAAVKAEGASSSTATDPTLANVELKSYLYDSGVFTISHQMTRDNVVEILPLLASWAAMRITNKVTTDATVGDGSSKITGFMTTATSGVTAASATAVTFDELISLEHSVNKPYRTKAGCAWTMRGTTLAAIRKLKDTAGNYIWQPGVNGAPDAINGYKVVENENMSAMTTGLKPIAFGNFSYYVLRRIGSPVIVIDAVTQMITNNCVALKVIQGHDGKLLVAGAIKYVTLA